MSGNFFGGQFFGGGFFGAIVAAAIENYQHFFRRRFRR
jgi:hypothetical protein